MVDRSGTVALTLTLVLMAGAALAHPSGNHSTDCSVAIEVAPETTVLHQVVALAEIPTEEEMPFIDDNGDGHVTERELDDYADEMGGRFAPGIELIVNGSHVAMNVGRAEGFISPGDRTLDVLRIEVDHVADALQVGDEVEFTDKTCSQYEGWKEVIVYATRGAIIEESSVPAFSISSQLRDHPEDARPSRVSRARFKVGGSAEATDADADEGEPDAPESFPWAGVIFGLAVLALLALLLRKASNEGTFSDRKRSK